MNVATDESATHCRSHDLHMIHPHTLTHTHLRISRDHLVQSLSYSSSCAAGPRGAAEADCTFPTTPHTPHPHPLYPHWLDWTPSPEACLQSELHVSETLCPVLLEVIKDAKQRSCFQVVECLYGGGGSRSTVIYIEQL